MQTFENAEIAGLPQRMVAFIIDQILISIIVVILIFLGVGSLLGITIVSGGKMAPISIMGALSIGLLSWLLWIIYFTYFEGGSGQTIGKKAMNIRVIKANGTDMDYFSAFVRNLLRIIDSLPTLYILGLLLMLVTKDRQRLGDMAAGTVVVTV